MPALKAALASISPGMPSSKVWIRAEIPSSPIECAGKKERGSNDEES